MTSTTPTRTVPASVILPGDPAWDEARQAWNALVDQQPAAIARPASVADVVEAVRGRAATGLRVAPQSTGHAASSIGDLSETLLLQTGGLSDVAIDAERGIARARRRGLWEEVVDAAAPATAWPRFTARPPTSASPATRSAAAWAGSPACTAWRRTR